MQKCASGGGSDRELAVRRLVTVGLCGMCQNSSTNSLLGPPSLGGKQGTNTSHAPHAPPMRVDAGRPSSVHRPGGEACAMARQCSLLWVALALAGSADARQGRELQQIGLVTGMVHVCIHFLLLLVYKRLNEFLIFPSLNASLHQPPGSPLGGGLHTCILAAQLGLGAFAAY